MKEITDQAGFIASTGFWDSPVGKLWREQEKERIKQLKKEGKWREPKAVGMFLPVNKNTTLLERLED